LDSWRGPQFVQPHCEPKDRACPWLAFATTPPTHHLGQRHQHRHTALWDARLRFAVNAYHCANICGLGWKASAPNLIGSAPCEGDPSNAEPACSIIRRIRKCIETPLLPSKFSAAPIQFGGVVQRLWNVEKLLTKL
jgi:hypothetical protein